jgi:ssDNA thymidine ADP-ribosyltransferase, DarT
MLFKRRGEAGSLCVLGVSLGALEIDGTVITDSNAASDYSRFLHPTQWSLINFDDVLAENWTHPNDPRRYYQHKSRKCAEVLVPNRVPPHLLIGARVINQVVSARLAALVPNLPITIDPVMFFRQ